MKNQGQHEFIKYLHKQVQFLSPENISMSREIQWEHKQWVSVDSSSLPDT